MQYSNMPKFREFKAWIAEVFAKTVWLGDRRFSSEPEKSTDAGSDQIIRALQNEILQSRNFVELRLSVELALKSVDIIAKYVESAERYKDKEESSRLVNFLKIVNAQGSALNKFKEKLENLELVMQKVKERLDDFEKRIRTLPPNVVEREEQSIDDEWISNIIDKRIRELQSNTGL